MTELFASSEVWGGSRPQHLNPLADRDAAKRRVTRSVVIAFIVAILVFGGFYLGSLLKGPSTSGATSTTETQPANP